MDLWFFYVYIVVMMPCILFGYFVFYIVIYSFIIGIDTIGGVFIFAFLIRETLESVCFLKICMGKNEMNLQTKNVKKMLSYALTICFLFSMIAVALPYATAASPLDVSYLTLAPGSDEAQLNFSWHTAYKADSPVVRIWQQNGETIEFTGTSSAATSTLSTMYYNRVTVTGLETDTDYTYQLGDGNDNWSVEYTTKTGNPNSFSYIVFGDPQVSSQAYGNSWKNTLELALGVNPDVAFMASTGDNIDSNTRAQYDYFFTPQSIFSVLPLATCMGNHEGSGIAPHAFYNPPNTNGGSDVVSYWYRYGDALFIVWDCTTGNAAGFRNFLQNAIDANPDATWKILNFHYDVYGQGSSHALSDGKTYRDTYVPVIDEFDIDVVFNGHDHSYSRSYPMKWSGSSSTSNNQGMQPENLIDGKATDLTGTVYFSLNSASGQKYYSLVAKQAYTAVMQQANRPHFSIVDVTVNTFICTTYQVNADNSLTLIDTYTIKKTIAADYTAVDEAIAVATALNGEWYENFADVEAAINDVEFDLEITEQATVDGFAQAIYDAIDSLELKVYSVTPSAYVTQLNGNKNDLTIAITEELADGTTNTLTKTFSINNNAADTYTVGSYRVYVDTKGNTQIRDCYIV